MHTQGSRPPTPNAPKVDGGAPGQYSDPGSQTGRYRGRNQYRQGAILAPLPAPMGDLRDIAAAWICKVSSIAEGASQLCSEYPSAITPIDASKHGVLTLFPIGLHAAP